MATRRVVVLDRFGPPSVMRWDEAPMPERGEREVRVAVDAIGVNFADTMVRRGEYRRDQPLGFTPGFEVAGRVMDGPDDGPPEGTVVVAFTEHGGGYADHVVVPLDHVLRVADGVTAAEAAALFTQGVTAWYAVHRYGGVGPGEAVVVHAAAGGLGALCVQLCAEAGARPIATASTEAKLDVARRHGAVAATLSDVDGLAERLRDLTGGRGADVIIDGVGGPLFRPSMRALAFNGRLVVVGSASQQPAELDVRSLMPRGQSVVGFVVARVAELDAAEPQLAFDEVQARFRDGRLRPEVAVLGPGDIGRAHELIEARTLTGKLVLDVARADWR